MPDGLIVALRDAEVDGQKLSEDELVSMIFLLFGAGQETTTHLIAGGLFALFSHEDQLRRLQRDPRLMPTCVEECLRYVSPVQMTKPRFATRDMTWMGSQLLRGRDGGGISGGGELRSGEVRGRASPVRHQAPSRTHTSPSAPACISALVSSLLGRRQRSRSSASSPAFRKCALPSSLGL